MSTGLIFIFLTLICCSRKAQPPESRVVGVTLRSEVVESCLGANVLKRPVRAREVSNVVLCLAQSDGARFGSVARFVTSISSQQLDALAVLVEASLDHPETSIEALDAVQDALKAQPVAERWVHTLSEPNQEVTAAFARWYQSRLQSGRHLSTLVMPAVSTLKVNGWGTLVRKSVDAAETVAESEKIIESWTDPTGAVANLLMSYDPSFQSAVHGMLQATEKDLLSHFLLGYQTNGSVEALINSAKTLVSRQSLIPEFANRAKTTSDLQSAFQLLALARPLPANFDRHARDAITVMATILQGFVNDLVNAKIGTAWIDRQAEQVWGPDLVEAVKALPVAVDRETWSQSWDAWLGPASPRREKWFKAFREAGVAIIGNPNDSVGQPTLFPLNVRFWETLQGCLFAQVTKLGDEVLKMIPADGTISRDEIAAYFSKILTREVAVVQCHTPEDEKINREYSFRLGGKPGHLRLYEDLDAASLPGGRRTHLKKALQDFNLLQLMKPYYGRGYHLRFFVQEFVDYINTGNPSRADVENAPLNVESPDDIIQPLAGLKYHHWALQKVFDIGDLPRRMGRDFLFHWMGINGVFEELIQKGNPDKYGLDNIVSSFIIALINDPQSPAASTPFSEAEAQTVAQILLRARVVSQLLEDRTFDQLQPWLPTGSSFEKLHGLLDAGADYGLTDRSGDFERLSGALAQVFERADVLGQILKGVLSTVTFSDLRHAFVFEGVPVLNASIDTLWKDIAQPPEQYAAIWKFLNEMADQDQLGPVLRFLSALDDPRVQRLLALFQKHPEELKIVADLVADRGSELWDMFTGFLDEPEPYILNVLASTSRFLPPASRMVMDRMELDLSRREARDFLRALGEAWRNVTGHGPGREYSHESLVTRSGSLIARKSGTR
jgi:hypothetical protein